MDDALDENAPANGHTGITLVLPSLRALQAANAGKKSKPKQPTDPDQRPKVSRPVKLKPLKEVLSKLITQIKKKDDYAFFIHPVDPARVPGYSDAIKTPMDFGTMTAKVTKGRYRSLEDFTSDFRLVTANAKTFNPPGSIYYTEADRIEAWGLDHIARASAHVIEYETDWNIDIEQDEDASLVNIDDEPSTPRDPDGSLATGSRAPSMTPAPGQAPTHGQGKRGPRGPYKKHTQSALSEGLDADGRMPGFKDGVGVFPAGSDWAELMIALKIKGKRYKTKKERLRFEKEGPPYHPDGSLDYAEMEDPFSFLNVLAPEPLVRPQVTSLYPPTSTAPINVIEGSQLRIHSPMPVTISPNRASPVLLTNIHIPPPAATTTSTPKRRRHWTVVRNVSTRSRGKDKEGDSIVDDVKTNSNVSRDAGPADYGSFATLLGELAASDGSEHQLFSSIRSSIEQKRETTASKERDEGWDYLRDVVYGGVDGYAYVRSLAEFVAPSVYRAREDVEDEKWTVDEGHPLGVPLARYVEDNLVDMVTRGRHGLLRDVLSTTTMPLHVRLAALPGAVRQLEELLDMAALVRVPEELAMDNTLEGGEGGEQAGIARALAWSAEMVETLAKREKVKVEDEEMEVDEDPLMKRVRLNLLALAKRAPLARVAKLPVDLVPEHMRDIVPIAV